MLTIENEYFIRLFLLLAKGGTECLRKFLNNVLENEGIKIEDVLSRHIMNINEDLMSQELVGMYSQMDISEWSIPELSSCIRVSFGPEILEEERHAVNNITKVWKDLFDNRKHASISLAKFSRLWEDLTVSLPFLTEIRSKTKSTESQTGMKLEMLISGIDQIDMNDAKRQILELKSHDELVINVQEYLSREDTLEAFPAILLSEGRLSSHSTPGSCDSGYMSTPSSAGKMTAGFWAPCKDEDNLPTGKTPWTECIAAADVKTAHELLKQGIFPYNKELLQALLVFGRRSEVFSKICGMLYDYIKSTSTKIIDTWASYSYKDWEEHGKVIRIIFVVITKDSSENLPVYGYNTAYRCVTDFSRESDILLEHELSDDRNIPNEQEISKNMAKCISKHADEIMDKHSNISVISPSFKRSVGYRSASHRILDEPCVSIYVHIKGLIPIQEDPLPRKIGEFSVDVLEGEFIPLTGAPNEFHNQLKMGLAITANVIEEKSNVIAGTLGGFLDHPVHGLCGITCAHVVSSMAELGKGQRVFSNDRPVFQPVGQAAEPFGNVVSIINDEGSELSPGLEVAIFKITDRHPVNGRFPEAFNYNEAGFDDANPLTYNSGETREASDILPRTEVYKFGMASGITRGSFRLQGSIVRKEEMKGQRRNVVYRLKNQMEVLQIGENPFAEAGDSGALVFMEGGNKDSVAIGIVEGAIRGRIYVTPICDILRAFNCTCMSLKQFRNCSHKNSFTSISTDSGIVVTDDQMDVSDS